MCKKCQCGYDNALYVVLTQDKFNDKLKGHVDYVPCKYTDAIAVDMWVYKQAIDYVHARDQSYS